MYFNTSECNITAMSDVILNSTSAVTECTADVVF